MTLEPSNSLAPSDTLAPSGTQLPAPEPLAPSSGLAPSNTLAPGGRAVVVVQQSLGIFYPEQPLVGDLGCGSYTAYLMNSGLTVNYGELAPTQITWNRGYGTQTGQLTVPRGACDPLLSIIDKWRYEVAIYRSGTGRIVSGPVTGYEITADQATITFSDVSAWYAKRKIHHTHRYPTPGTDLATIFQDYSDDALGVDNHMGVQVSASPTNILSVQTVLSGQHLIAGDQLQALMDAGIDWYVIDRTVVAGGVAVGVAPVATLRDEHFIGQPTIASGDGEANVYGVRGAGAGQGSDPVYEEATDDVDASLYGVLEAVDTVDVITHPNDALQAARARLALLSPPPLLVSDGVLDPRAPIQAAQLVPGALITLHLQDTAKPISGTYRISSVAANISNGDEQLTITTQPVGSVTYRLTKPPSKQFERVFNRIYKRLKRLEAGSAFYGELSLGPVIHLGPVTLRATQDPDTGQILVTIEDTLNGGRSTPVAVLP